MIKNKFIKSSLILLIGSVFSKLMGAIIKILQTRILGPSIIFKYSSIMPTFMFLISLSSCGIPIATERLIAKGNYRSSNILINSFIISFIINIVLSIIILIFGKFFIINILKDKDLVLANYFIIPIIFFTSISSIIRSYFFGKERMGIISITSFLENLFRLIIVLLVYPLIKTFKYKYAILSLIVIYAFTEGFSILFFLFFIPRRGFDKNIISFNRHIFKLSFKTSFYTTLTGLINSLAFFIEMNIITYFNTFNMSLKPIYLSILNYTLPIILLPSFISLTISSSLIPRINKLNSYKSIYKTIRLALTIIFIISFILLLTIYIYGSRISNILFKYPNPLFIRTLVPFFIFQYMIYPVNAYFDAKNKSYYNFYISLISFFIRTILLFILLKIYINIYVYIFITIFNIIISFIIYFYLLHINLKQNKKA